MRWSIGVSACTTPATTESIVVMDWKWREKSISAIAVVE
jgi:hypothetical protein